MTTEMTPDKCSRVRWRGQCSTGLVPLIGGVNFGDDARQGGHRKVIGGCAAAIDRGKIPRTDRGLATISLRGRIQAYPVSCETSGRQEADICDAIAERLRIGIAEIIDEPPITTELPSMFSACPAEIVRKVVDGNNHVGRTKIRRGSCQTAEENKLLRGYSIVPDTLTHKSIV